MSPKQSNKTKHPRVAERPFPWQCRQCGERAVRLTTTNYDAEVRHDGRLHKFTIADLELPICQACGEKVFTEQVDAQFNDALRSHLKLLTPVQMCAGIKRVRMRQKDITARLGIAEATLSRWLNETQIQSRAMDNLLRAFFAFPQLRAAFCPGIQDPELGLSDVAQPQQRKPRLAIESSWPNDRNQKRAAEHRLAYGVIESARSTWGMERVA